MFWLIVSAVSLYLVAPSLVAAFGSWHRIQRLSPAWLVAMALLQRRRSSACGSSSGCRCRGALAAGDRSQLAGNALAKIAPGGGAMGSALQYRMLVEAGMPRRNAVFGAHGVEPAAVRRCARAAVAGHPAILRGGVERDLLNAAVRPAVFVLLFIDGVVLLSSDRPLLWLGRMQRARNRSGAVPSR